ncbi:hypothetical protein CDD81_5108 [Ophiocordyceps australis]|uniref:Uncharacterized protein n=1 Tax=Ophiocordyceps australis TaxID=1399860 RepID=A0A2C5Y8Q4_9HYPO|nr:hypothetical protein CDD81_5108 [Ophiocordyceps australis]
MCLVAETLFTVCLHQTHLDPVGQRGGHDACSHGTRRVRLVAGWCPTCKEMLASSDVDVSAESTIRTFWLYMKSRNRQKTPAQSRPWMVMWLDSKELTQSLVDKADDKWTECLQRELDRSAAARFSLGNSDMSGESNEAIAQRARVETVEWARGYRLGLEEWDWGGRLA